MPLGTFLNGINPTRLRGLQAIVLSDIGNVGTLTSTDDAGGGASQAWAYGSDIPCRVDPLGGDESVVAGRLDDRSTHLITVPARTDVDTNDRFQVTGQGTFEVTAVRSRTGEWTRVFETVQVS